jgi:hypothetical protein
MFFLFSGNCKSAFHCDNEELTLIIRQCLCLWFYRFFAIVVVYNFLYVLNRIILYISKSMTLLQNQCLVLLPKHRSFTSIPWRAWVHRVAKLLTSQRWLRVSAKPDVSEDRPTPIGSTKTSLLRSSSTLTASAATVATSYLSRCVAKFWKTSGNWEAGTLSPHFFGRQWRRYSIYDQDDLIAYGNYVWILL